MVDNNLEVDVAEWLLYNKTDLSSQISKRHNPAYHLFPDALFCLYVDTYKENLCSIVREEVCKAMGLHIDSVYDVATNEWLTTLLGEAFFKLEKENV